MTSSHPLPVPCQWFARLASALDRRSAPRLALLFLAAVLARGRRTVTSWIRAAGLSGHFQHCYTAVAAAGKKAKTIAAYLVLRVVEPLLGGVGRLTVALDDTPTERYGPHVVQKPACTATDTRPAWFAVRHLRRRLRRSYGLARYPPGHGARSPVPLVGLIGGTLKNSRKWPWLQGLPEKSPKTIEFRQLICGITLRNTNAPRLACRPRPIKRAGVENQGLPGSIHWGVRRDDPASFSL